MQVDNKKIGGDSPAYQHIFLLSHMRANTSLISHILGSHPQISGYYEMHISYCTDDDLSKQKIILTENEGAEQLGRKRQHYYLFDKILHNDYKLLLDKLSSETFKILIAIRPPEQSIKSIIHLFRNKTELHPYANPANATEYYLDRIKELSRFCESYKNNYYYYDANLIRTDSKKSLKRIQKWLALTVPLSEKYQVFSLTGQSRVGDSSENMTKGQIIKQQTNYDEIEVPSQLLQTAIAETSRYRQLIIDQAIDSMTF